MQTFCLFSGAGTSRDSPCNQAAPSGRILKDSLQVTAKVQSRELTIAEGHLPDLLFKSDADLQHRWQHPGAEHQTDGMQHPHSTAELTLVSPQG